MTLNTVRNNLTKILLITLGFVVAVTIGVAISNQPDKVGVDTLSAADEMATEVKEGSDITAQSEAENLSENEIELFTITAEQEPMAAKMETEFIELDQNKAFEIVAEEFNRLQSKDVDTVTKYFGTSDIFTPETVGDRITASKVTCTSFEVDETQNYSVNLHICTLDYKMMNEDFTVLAEDKSDEDAKKTVAENLLSDKYTVHYNIPITIDRTGNIMVSEAFKQAITGGWYTGIGVTLESTECSLT